MNQKSTWIFFFPFLYLFGFFFLGIFLFSSEALEYPPEGEGLKHGLKILFSSVLYLILGVSGFIFVTIYTIYSLVKKKAFFLAIQRHWPLILALLYPFLPNLPGPVDEMVVSTILGGLAVYFGWKKEPQKLKDSQETSGG